MSPRRFIRLLLRVLLIFLLLDILLLAGWLWKGPDLLSPLIPRILAIYLPDVHGILRFEQANLDHRGVITLRNVKVNSTGALSLNAGIPELKASLSIASLRRLEPVFARLELDSVLISAQTDRTADPLLLADSLLELLRTLPDMRAFSSARARIQQATLLYQNDTLGRVQDLRLDFAQQDDSLSATLAFSGQLRHPHARLQMEQARARIVKTSGRPFWLDSLAGSQLELRVSKRAPWPLQRDSLLARAIQPRDYRWKRHLAAQVLSLDQVRVLSHQQAAILFQHLQLHIGAAQEPWILRTDLQGSLGDENFYVDSLQVSLHLPDTLGIPGMAQFAIDSLHVSAAQKSAVLHDRRAVAALFRDLGRHPLRALLQQGSGQIRTAVYFWNAHNHVQVSSVNARYFADSMQLQLGHFAWVLQKEAVSGQRLQASLHCGKETALPCRARIQAVDSLRLAFQQARIAQGPAAMIREGASWYNDPLWNLLDGSALVIPYSEWISSGGFSWKFWDARIRISAPTTDSAQLQLSYRQWNMVDSVLIQGWLLRQLNGLSKGAWHQRNLGTLLDTLDFQEGKGMVYLVPAGYRFQWESALNSQTRTRMQIDGELDTRNSRPALSGKATLRGLSLAQTFPVLFDQAFTQGLRASGGMNAQGTFQIPLSALNRLENFSLQGSLTVYNGVFQGLYLQKQSLVRSKAPPFTGKLPFDELRVEGLTLDRNGIHARHIAGKGDLFRFTGWLSARYDASFYLQALAYIPPGTAQKLPTLTRNGMERTSDGGREARLIVYGTPLRQEISNQGKLVNRAILNNLKSGFGLFSK